MKVNPKSIMPLLSSLSKPVVKVKYQFLKKKHDKNIVEELVKARSALVFMPEKIEHFGAALQFVQQLKEERPDWQITALTRSETVGLVEQDKLKIDIQPYDKSDISTLGLPKSTLKNNLKSKRYDVGLDLSIENNNFAVYLMHFCGANVTVAFDSKEKSCFYNLSIRVPATEALAEKYHTMLKYINAIANSQRLSHREMKS